MRYHISVGWRRKTGLLLVAFVLTTIPTFPCSWARGYFIQLTALRGAVVGAKLGPLQYVRWLRQAFVRPNVRLGLFEYRWPISNLEEMRQIKSVTTDNRGYFDFGEIKEGHYTLVVENGWGGADWFDVEVTPKAPHTQRLWIDVSPHFPDCKGGHEIVIESGEIH